MKYEKQKAYNFIVFLKIFVVSFIVAFFINVMGFSAKIKNSIVINTYKIISIKQQNNSHKTSDMLMLIKENDELKKENLKLKTINDQVSGFQESQKLNLSSSFYINTPIEIMFYESDFVCWAITSDKAEIENGSIVAFGNKLVGKVINVKISENGIKLIKIQLANSAEFKIPVSIESFENDYYILSGNNSHDEMVFEYTLPEYKTNIENLIVSTTNTEGLNLPTLVVGKIKIKHGEIIVKLEQNLKNIKYVNVIQPKIEIKQKIISNLEPLEKI